MDELIGRTIGRRYRVTAFLGKGGMAEVYKVWDLNRSVDLAMKILHADLAEDRIFLRRFRREAETLAELQHPNIVRFYGLEEDDGLVYMLMDCVEGSTLRREIFETRSPFRMERILEIMRPICAALSYAHKLGYVHCDVKPANIMMSANGTVYVSDFGIARLTDSSTMTLVGAGTPAYMAPEQIRGELPVPQTDIYALGVILFELLTGGERPFTGEGSQVTTGSTTERVRWEHLKMVPPAPSTINPSVRKGMDRIVLRCLEKDSSARYPTATELLNDLSAQIIGQALPTNPTAPVLPPHDLYSDRTGLTATSPDQREESLAPTELPPPEPPRPVHDAEPPRISPLPGRRIGMVLVGVFSAILVVAAGVFFLMSPKPTPTPAIVPTVSAAPTLAPVEVISSATPVPSDTPVPPTPTTVVTPTAEMYFTKTFTTDHDNWSVTLVKGDQSKFNLDLQDGGLLFDLQAPRVYAYLHYDAMEYTDVRMEAQAENRGGNDNNVTLFCRYSPTAGWYEFNLFSSGLYNILLAKPNEVGTINYGTIAEGGSKNIKQGQAQNDYAAVCQGNTLTLYINGTLTRQVNAPASMQLASGKVGFSVSSLDHAPVQVVLDQYQISRP